MRHFETFYSNRQLRSFSALAPARVIFNLVARKSSGVCQPLVGGVRLGEPRQRLNSKALRFIAYAF
jgi:hypothetical protein